jgi:hypothetical protein
MLKHSLTFHINLKLAQNSRQAKPIDAPNYYAKDLLFPKSEPFSVLGPFEGRYRADSVSQCNEVSLMQLDTSEWKQKQWPVNGKQPSYLPWVEVNVGLLRATTQFNTFYSSPVLPQLQS